MDKKLIFHITFHNQIEQLKFHLDTILSWKCSRDIDIVLTSAHRDNLTIIENYCNAFYSDYDFDCVFIEEDHGYHKGTLYNVNEGIKYINEYKDYDYIVNVEADNMFYIEDKFFDLLNKMESEDKHLLIVDWVTKGDSLYTNYPELPKYHSLSTLNIYSKYFINNHYPLDYYEDLMDLGWNSNPGTPFEDYLSMAFSKKHSLDTEDKVREYFKHWAYYLEYNIWWKLHPNNIECTELNYYDKDKQLFVCHCGKPLPQHFYFRDALTPERFTNYGLVLCTTDLQVTKNFINLYKPYLK